jgi:hypothetical protein
MPSAVFSSTGTTLSTSEVATLLTITQVRELVNLVVKFYTFIEDMLGSIVVREICYSD